MPGRNMIFLSSIFLSKAAAQHCHRFAWRQRQRSTPRRERAGETSQLAKRLECGAFTAAFSGAARRAAGSHRGAQRHADVELEAAECGRPRSQQRATERALRVGSTCLGGITLLRPRTGALQTRGCSRGERLNRSRGRVVGVVSGLESRLRLDSGAEARALQTLARGFCVLERRAAYGVRRVHRRFRGREAEHGREPQRSTAARGC